jgi:hypothetical protein
MESIFRLSPPPKPARAAPPCSRAPSAAAPAACRRSSAGASPRLSHARISYRDYAISPTRFNWQTQNFASRRPRPAAGTWRAPTTGGPSSSSCGRGRGSVPGVRAGVPRRPGLGRQWEPADEHREEVADAAAGGAVRGVQRAAGVKKPGCRRPIGPTHSRPVGLSRFVTPSVRRRICSSVASGKFPADPPLRSGSEGGCRRVLRQREQHVPDCSIRSIPALNPDVFFDTLSAEVPRL